MGTEDARAGETEAQRRLRAAAAELLAVPELEPVTPESFESELQQRLTALEHEANERLAEHADPEGEARRCPLLHTSGLAPVIQQALLEAKPGFGCAFAELARVYPVDRQGDVQDFSTLVPPVVPLALAVRLDGRVAVRMGISEARKVSPGTTWDELKPWRAKVKPETREQRLRAWLADAEEPPLEAPLEVVRAWLGQAREHAADEAALAAGLGAIDPPSEKQLAFVESLLEQKGLSEQALEALLLEVGGVRKLAHLDRAHASPLIEALLALPNAKRKRAPTKRKRAASGAAEKLSWSGTVLAVRPRIKSVLLGGEAKHSYQGYVLVLEGTLGEVARTFAVGLGKAAQGKHGFRAGDRASGAGVAIDDPAGHACDLHKASKLAREPGPEPAPGGPPYLGAPEPLEVYRAAGHRPLGEGALAEGPCASCVWACRMPSDAGKGALEVSEVCYGPLDCPAYAPF
ncbi:MAG: hypothetical protein KDD82_03720 [Planctomycetes bacterium]|nr:hypothetical protein [Planctomycetota bacterium]